MDGEPDETAGEDDEEGKEDEDELTKECESG